MPKQEPTYKFHEALKKLVENCSCIARKAWSDRSHFLAQADGGRIWLCDAQSQSRAYWKPDDRDLMANDWVVIAP